MASLRMTVRAIDVPKAGSRIRNGLQCSRKPCSLADCPGTDTFHGPMQLQKTPAKPELPIFSLLREGRGAGHLRTDVRRPICENALVMTFPGLTMIWLLGDQLVGTHSTAGFGTSLENCKGGLWSYSAIWDVNTKERSTYVSNLLDRPFSVFWSL